MKTEDVKLANCLVKFVPNIFLNIKERSKEIWFPFHYKYSLPFFSNTVECHTNQIIFLFKLTFAPKIVIFKCTKYLEFQNLILSSHLFAAKKIETQTF